jgi:hypothetical protein
LLVNCTTAQLCLSELRRRAPLGGSDESMNSNSFLFASMPIRRPAARQNRCHHPRVFPCPWGSARSCTTRTIKGAIVGRGLGGSHVCDPYMSPSEGPRTPDNFPVHLSAYPKMLMGWTNSLNNPNLTRKPTTIHCSPIHIY